MATVSARGRGTAAARAWAMSRVALAVLFRLEQR
jgi:hypothetical protein